MKMLPVVLEPRVLGPAVLLSVLAATAEIKLKDGDHKTLSKAVGGYFTALTDEKGIFEAFQKVSDQFEASEKKLKGQKLLASVGDLEQVFRLVTEDRLQNTLKKRGEVTPAKVKSNNIELSLAYCVPKKVPKDGALPLVLVACDAGEAPNAHLDAHWNDAALREGAVLVAVDLGKDEGSWGMFGSPTSPGGTYTLMTALAVIQREFAIDFDRRFLVGSGKGFAAVEATAASYPYLFAGIVGIGDVKVVDAENLENFRTLPSIFLKGGEGAKEIETKIGELGYGNCRVEPEGGVAQASDWLGKTTRDSYPAHVTFVPKADNASTVHWLSLVGFQAAEKPRIDAKADRASNTITIDCQKIADLVILLNDELVDLSKPVRFVINGATHERTVERNAKETVERQYRGGDWGRVFTASVTQSVPEKK